MAIKKSDEQPVMEEPVMEAPPKRKMVTIRIPRGGRNEENFITASVNGEIFKIMRGVDVEVPEYIAEVLRHRAEMLDQADDFIEKKAN